jgi:hypothetical protein
MIANAVWISGSCAVYSRPAMIGSTAVLAVTNESVSANVVARPRAGACCGMRGPLQATAAGQAELSRSFKKAS